MIAGMGSGARIPCVLSIAGSDSGGGAGIQADLKAFAACGVHGMTALTAITAQNTTGVTAVHQIPAETIVAQVAAVAEDLGVDAVKIGMLGNAVTIAAVAGALDDLPPTTPIVLDPVMVAESGSELLEASARAALIELLLPRATVVTPNLAEAWALISGGRDEHRPEAHATDADVAELARRVFALGPSAVVITGGHRDQATDLFFDGVTLVQLPGERHRDGGAHGSGCTHSSVLAARLAWGDEPVQAARRAKELAALAVRDGLRQLGAGPGPVNVLGAVQSPGPARTVPRSGPAASVENL